MTVCGWLPTWDDSPPDGPVMGRNRRVRAEQRGPWLSGLLVALVGAVWMIGQVLGGVVSFLIHLLQNPVGF